MKVVVTGGNGQLGRCLRDLFSTRNDIDATYIDVEDLDITDASAVDRYFDNKGADLVINCAAYTAVDKAESEKEQAFAVNVCGPENIARTAGKRKFKVIHISTDFVYGGSKLSPYKEEDEPDGNSVYGFTKAAGERIMRRLLPSSIVIRTAWLYSSYGRNFFLIMKEKALAGERVKVVNDQRGTPTNAADLALAILKIMDSDVWVPGIYHYTSEGETSWYDYAKEIYRLIGADTKLVTPISTRDYGAPAQRPGYSVLDTEKIRQTFGVEIRPWKESLYSVWETAEK